MPLARSCANTHRFHAQSVRRKKEKRKRRRGLLLARRSSPPSSLPEVARSCSFCILWPTCLMSCPQNTWGMPADVDMDARYFENVIHIGQYTNTVNNYHSDAKGIKRRTAFQGRNIDHTNGWVHTLPYPNNNNKRLRDIGRT